RKGPIMPAYTATDSWSAAITVAAGDIIQNTGHRVLLVCPVTPAADGDAVDLHPDQPGFAFDRATTQANGPISSVARADGGNERAGPRVSETAEKRGFLTGQREIFSSGS
ncbi:hypothetical protein, partial [Paracoccus lutimaris]